METLASSHSILKFIKNLNNYIKIHVENAGENFDQFQKRLIHFTWHSCNTAHGGISEEKEKSNLSDEEQILQVQDRILNRSVMGIFYNEMTKLGYSRITVTGYRGYYFSKDRPGLPPVVSTHPNSHHLQAKDFRFDQASFIIDEKGIVHLPKQKKDAQFRSLLNLSLFFFTSKLSIKLLCL